MADLGQGDDLESIRQKALNSGATQSVMGNLVDNFAEKYAFLLLEQMHCMVINILCRCFG